MVVVQCKRRFMSSLKSNTLEWQIYMYQILIRWRLREVMARYNIKSKDLAKELDISPNAMSALRKAKTMPRIDGLALNLMCNALNELAEDLEAPITPGNLLDYSVDPKNPPEADKVFSLIKRKRAKRKNLLHQQENEELTSSKKGVA